jgi:hypothetical protein
VKNVYPIFHNNPFKNENNNKDFGWDLCSGESLEIEYDLNKGTQVKVRHHINLWCRRIKGFSSPFAIKMIENKTNPNNSILPQDATTSTWTFDQFKINMDDKVCIHYHDINSTIPVSQLNESKIKKHVVSETDCILDIAITKEKLKELRNIMEDKNYSFTVNTNSQINI